VKKYLVLALAAMFVLGFAASSFAIHAEIPAETQAVVAAGATQITLGGDLRFRGMMMRNTLDFNSHNVASGDASFYDARVRLSVEAKVTPNTTGKITLESGGNNINDTYQLGSEGTDARGGLAAGNAKGNTMVLLEGWILHQGSGLFGVNSFIKVGHMPVKIDGLFYDHTKYGDDAVLFGIYPVKELEIVLGTVKLTERGVATTTAGDINGYTTIVGYTINKDSKIGMDLTYLDAQNGALLGGTSADAHLFNLAINGKSNFGVPGLGIAAEIDIQRGKFVDQGTPDTKLRGMATKFDVDYTIKPVKIMGAFAYGTGEDRDKGDNKSRLFYTSQSYIQHYTFVYDYLTNNAAGFRAGGLQNTWYLKAGVSADIVKNLDGALNAYYLHAVKRYVADTAANRDAGLTKKDIGVEVDANINYQIDKNLKYFVEGGYLFAGNFMKNFTTKIDSAGVRQSPDDAWAIRHGIQLSF
jgi:hypothetical protein